MLADNLDRIVAKLSRELVRALRDLNQKELLALLPHLSKELAATKASVSKKSHFPKVRSAPTIKPKEPRGKTVQRKKLEIDSPRKRGAGSLTRQILKLLAVRREGFRFEEIQRRFKTDSIELRETLAVLLSTDRVVRNGQARGTRYSLPLGDDSEGSREQYSPSSADFFEPAPEPPALIEITDAMINDVRSLLIQTSSPTSIQEFQNKLPFTRDQLKAILDRMKQSGLIERVGKGPSPRYQLTSHSPKKSSEPLFVRGRPGKEPSAKDSTEVSASSEPSTNDEPSA